MSYLATIARETSWSREEILWGVSVSLGFEVIHCAGIHHGNIMKYDIPRTSSASIPHQELADMRETFAAAREAWLTESGQD